MSEICHILLVSSSYQWKEICIMKKLEVNLKLMFALKKEIVESGIGFLVGSGEYLLTRGRPSCRRR